MHKIVSNYNVLLEDKIPLMYTGLNIYGCRVLGAILQEQEEKKALEYLHILITEKDYLKFINRKITLIKIIMKAKKIFTIYKSYNNDIFFYQECLFNIIPRNLLPLDNSFYPII